jgi:hypothetical protein
VKSNYDVYMCRPDNRPTLTIDKLRQFQTTLSNNWYESVDIHTAIRRARNAGYKVPFDIFQSYLADEQKRRVEPLFDGQIGTETRAVSKHRCVQSALWWLK